MKFKMYISESNEFWQAKSDYTLNKTLEKDFKGWYATRNKQGKLELIHMSGKTVISPKRSTYSSLSKLLEME